MVLNVKLVLDGLANPSVDRFDLIPSAQRLVTKFFGNRFDPLVVAFNKRAGFKKGSNLGGNLFRDYILRGIVIAPSAVSPAPSRLTV